MAADVKHKSNERGWLLGCTKRNGNEGSVMGKMAALS